MVKIVPNSVLVRMGRNVRMWMVPVFVIKDGRDPIVRNVCVRRDFMANRAKIVVSAMRRIPKCKFYIACS